MYLLAETLHIYGCTPYGYHTHTREKDTLRKPVPCLRVRVLAGCGCGLASGYPGVYPCQCLARGARRFGLPARPPPRRRQHRSESPGWERERRGEEKKKRSAGLLSTTKLDLGSLESFLPLLTSIPIRGTTYQGRTQDSPPFRERERERSYCTGGPSSGPSSPPPRCHGSHHSDGHCYAGPIASSFLIACRLRRVAGAISDTPAKMIFHYAGRTIEVEAPRGTLFGLRCVFEQLQSKLNKP